MEDILQFKAGVLSNNKMKPILRFHPLYNTIIFLGIWTEAVEQRYRSENKLYSAVLFVLNASYRAFCIPQTMVACCQWFSGPSLTRRNLYTDSFHPSWRCRCCDQERFEPSQFSFALISMGCQHPVLFGIDFWVVLESEKLQWQKVRDEHSSQGVSTKQQPQCICSKTETWHFINSGTCLLNKRKCWTVLI